MFSSILDISSFFIGMLINLLLIALICYYFKRKYESLEVAQNEQAKILYNLIQSQAPRKQFDINELMNNNITKTLDTFESDSESESESESEDESIGDIKCLILNEPASVEVEDIDPTPLLITKILDEPTESKSVSVSTSVGESKSSSESKSVSESKSASEYKSLFEPISEIKTEDDYSKMTMKQLKDILSQKGISSNPRMKKNDLINLIETGVTDTLNLSGDLTEVII
jgi:hypothetical protein